MKRFLLFTISFIIGFTSLKSQRYLSEIFSEVNVTANVPYGANISVITGSITLDTLLCDIYTPVGDTLGERPLAVVLHT
ncbi:MAG: hypothetical protein R3275_12400, partial [Saprospiraceae bacterium]|nr:hypothetical protein [Saprospiraceae bacterium]